MEVRADGRFISMIQSISLALRLWMLLLGLSEQILDIQNTIHVLKELCSKVLFCYRQRVLRETVVEHSFVWKLFSHFERNIFSGTDLVNFAKLSVMICKYSLAQAVLTNFQLHGWQPILVVL